MKTTNYEFNYTGQRKIMREDFEIELSNNNGKLSFTLKLNFDRYEFNEDSEVEILAHYQGQIQKFDIGTVENLKIPSAFEITEIEGTNIVDFDIKVVEKAKSHYGTNDRYMLEGLLKNIRIGTKEANTISESALPINIIDIGDRPWNLQLTTSGPILELNSRIPDIKEKIKTDPVYKALIYPAVYRQILERIIYLNDVNSEEDNWQSKWIRFTQQALNISEIPKMGCEGNEPNEDQELWINQCVNELSRKNKLMEKLIYQETYE